MISWAVSTVGVLTGYTTASSTASISEGFNNADSSYTVSSIASANTSFSAFTSQDTSATTSANSSTYVATLSSSYSLSYTTSDSAGSGTYSESDSFLQTFNDTDSFSESGLLPTIQSQTSTTETYSTTNSATVFTTSTFAAWTTSQANSTSPVAFHQITETASTSTSTTQSQQSTTDATTTVSGTIVSSATARAVKAKTFDPDSEVVFYISSQELDWDKLSAASSIAQSTTEITLADIYSVTQPPTISVTIEGESDGNVIESGVPFLSWSNQSSTYSTRFTTSTSATSQTTIVADSFVIPNQTVTNSVATLQTTTISASAVLWQSGSGQCSDQNSTTTTFKEIATKSKLAGTYWSGTMSWHVPRTTTETRIATTATFAAYVRNMTNSVGLGITANGYAYSANSGETANRNIVLLNKPQVVTNIAQNIAQTKFVPVFANINNSSGLWFSVDATTLSDVSYNSVTRSRGTTIFPASTNGVSYGLSRVTYSITNGTQTTTTTAALRVAGQSTTTAILPEIGMVGGSPNASETFAYGIAQNGVFKNRANGATTSFSAGVTTFQGSLNASFFEPITGLEPAAGSGSTAVAPLFWVVPRNSTALPPVMPPYA